MNSTITNKLGSNLLERIAQALQGLRYGTLELVVHDFKVVRITRTEKVRVDAVEEQPR